MENLENNNQSNSVNPSVNASSPTGLNERISQQNPKAQHPKGRTGLFIFVVVLFTLIGVGGWWYYAQGQVMLLHRQMKLDLVRTGEHNQFEASLKSRVDVVGQENEFLGQNNFINAQAKQYIDNDDIDAEVSLSFTSQDNQGKAIDLKIFVRRIAENIYLKLKIDNLEELNLPLDINFGDKWIALNTQSLENNPFYSLKGQEIDSSEELKVKVQELADNLMDLGFLKISNPHQTIKNNGDTLRKIKYNVKEEKLKDLILTYLKYYNEIQMISIAQVGSGSGKSLEDLDQFKQEMYNQTEKSFLEFINNKPNEWEKMKQAIAKLDIYLWVNTNTKNIQGLELFVENLEMLDEDNKGVKISLDYKSMLVSVEAREIDTPADTQSLEDFMGNLMGGMMVGNTKTIDGYNGPLITPDNPEWFNNHTTDKIDSDSDGLSDALEDLYGTDNNNPDSDSDGYTDGEEVNNGYNPMGEGELLMPLVTNPSFDDWGVNDLDSDLDGLDGIKESCLASSGQWFDFSEENNDLCASLDFDLCVNEPACEPVLAFLGEPSCKGAVGCVCPEGFISYFDGCKAPDWQVQEAKASCAEENGQWMPAEKTTADCLAYGDFTGCEENNCAWSIVNNTCEGGREYCACPNGNTFYYDYGLGCN
jgi:hypothetical protein